MPFTRFSAFFFSCSSTDTPAELELVREEARRAGAFDAVVSNHWSKGGAGAVDLAKAVKNACNQPIDFKYLYDLNVSVRGEKKKSKLPVGNFGSL